MTEKIGNVSLVLDDYPGRDIYSDGEIEDELLEIAKTTDPDQFDRVVAEKKNWAVMYHFSTIRTNILSWYPFRKTDSVLEIGSGCGAITGAVAEKAGHVTCVDLSKKRSMVNAYRNRNRDNVEILLGNFQDVEKKLPATYDYITLIGVFEYGRGYISSDTPYLDFLKIIRRHLKPGGKILLAIENRLGMKYWAGCTEDHSGVLFEGIEGYPDNDRVRTFSKPELEKIMRLAGFETWKFYYPYPDYKFPMAIYSDEYLPKKGDIRGNVLNFDRARVNLFDESKAIDAMVDDGLFPLYSNSFLVVIDGGRT